MALHVTSINNMGSSTLTGSTITNTGMRDNDHMHISEDFVTGPGVLDLEAGEGKVTQSATLGKKVKVAKGRFYVLNRNWTPNQNSQTRFWRVVVDADEDGGSNLTVSPNTTLATRIDLVCIRINPSANPGNDGENSASFHIIEGTANATVPSIPNDGNSYEILAQLNLPQNYTDVLNSYITDLRVKATILGDDWRVIEKSNDPNLAIVQYVSSDKIKISGDWRKKIGINYRLKLTNGGQVKYFVTTDSGNYAGGYTTYTVSGGGLYTLSNAPILCAYYSNVVQPVGFPTNFRENLRYKYLDETNIIALAGPEGLMVNGRITTSVASNNLNVSIVGLDNSVPSPTNPIYVRIGNAIREITSSLSLTLNAGTNWFSAGSSMLATKEVDYFVYLGWRNSDSSVFLGLSRVPYGRTVNNFSTSNTSDKYLAYSGSAPATTDEVVVIGRITAVLSGSPNHHWSIPANSVIINRPIYHTRLLTYVPQAYTLNALTYTPNLNNTPNSIFYVIRNNLLKVYSYVTGTTSGTNNNLLAMSLPMTSTVEGGFIGIAEPAINGVFYTGSCFLANGNTNPAIVQKTYHSINFGVGSTVYFNASLEYPI